VKRSGESSRSPSPDDLFDVLQTMVEGVMDVSGVIDVEWA